MDTFDVDPAFDPPESCRFLVTFLCKIFLLTFYAQTVWIKSPASQKSYLWCSFFLYTLNPL